MDWDNNHLYDWEDSVDERVDERLNELFGNDEEYEHEQRNKWIMGVLGGLGVTIIGMVVLIIILVCIS